jgi:hypothetical protein
MGFCVSFSYAAEHIALLILHPQAQVPPRSHPQNTPHLPGYILQHHLCQLALLVRLRANLFPLSTILKVSNCVKCVNE